MFTADKTGSQRIWSVILLFVIILVSTGITGCSSDNPQNVTKQVNQHIEQDQYTQALDLLNDVSDQTKADSLREKVHLNYGLYLEYRGGDMEMRDRMTGALEQFINVLNINPANQKALNEIKQIMGVYTTMPNKNPPKDILKDLDRLGIAY